MKLLICFLRLQTFRFEENQWCDIMFDRHGNVYAIWAEDALTCFNSMMYLQLDRGRLQEAFSCNGRKSKLMNRIKTYKF